MFSSKQTNKRIDDIGKQLFSAAAMSDQELDEITSDPNAFDLVLSAIERQGTRSVITGRSRMRTLIPVTAGALGVLVVLSVLLLKQNSAERVVQEVQVPSESSESARLGITPQVTVKGFTAGRADLPHSESTALLETAIPRRSNKRPVTQNASARRAKSEAEFIPVSFSGDTRELVKGGRVIRVDVSRATLFAMGVDVPLENEAASVKADLVVGPDGVARAFRLVE